MNDYERVKQAVSLEEYAKANLDQVRGGMVCPNCGSGTGPNHSPAVSVKGDFWKCFSCDVGGDIFDLAAYVCKLSKDDKRGQLEAVADWGRVTLEHDNRNASNSTGKGFRASGTDYSKVSAETTSEADSAKVAPDYSEGRAKHRQYIAECARRMAEEPNEQILSYLSARGITHDEAVTLGIGYDLNPVHGWQDDGGNWHRSPRIVLPWLGSDFYHIDRAIDDHADKLKYDKPPSTPDEKHPLEECVGGQPLYNPDAFDCEYVVVVEGVLDAIAIQLCGYNAVALGGTGTNDFVNEAVARKYGGVVIDMLDCDGDAPTDSAKGSKGRGAGADLVALLEKNDVMVLSRAEYDVNEADKYGGAYKDAGEYFADSRDGLTLMLEYMKACASDKKQGAKEAGYREAMRRFNVKKPSIVARDVLDLNGVYEPIPTGIQSLDKALDGGLNLGELTIFGAVSSYGKTTIAVQVADHLASKGQPVLFVSVEQSAKEIVAKSLSRLVYTENLTGWNVATPSEIISLKARKAWGDGQNAVLTSAVECYDRLIAPNMLILEGIKRPSVKDIRQFASMMEDYNGKAPVIFIDYLQLLAPLSERYDDKKNVDVNVSELRMLARDFNTHVWAISSLNRDSYKGVICMDSFKESGGIEFGADLLLGLQPRDMAAHMDGVAENKRKREAEKFTRANKSKIERDCELVVLKRRNGAIPDEPIPLTFKTMAAYFLEPKGNRAR